MSVYYHDDHVTLYHGDCLTEHLEWLTADVLVTDPPYGMAWQSGMRHKDARLDPVAGDKTTESRDSALAAWGHVKPWLMFGTWRVNPPTGEKQRLIWHKPDTPGMGDLRIPWGTAHEDIHLGGVGWNREETNHKRSGSVIAAVAGAMGASGAANLTGHPTPKPVPLMELLIDRCPSGVIADPFAGSGSTLVAAKALGRRAIGVELEEKYCEVAAQRLSQEVLDLGGVS